VSWPQVRIDSVADINPRLPEGADENQKVSFVDMASVSENGCLLNEEFRVLSETKKGYTYFSKDDVLLAKITPCFENGKSLKPSQINSAIGYGSTEFHVCRAHEDRLDSKYLFYMLWSKHFRFNGQNSMSGAAGQKRVSSEFIKGYEIPLPPLKEQKRIAEILDKADSLRRKRQQAIQLADEFLRAVFLDMFGKIISSLSNTVRFGDVVLLDAKMVDPRESKYSSLVHIGPDRITKGSGKLLPGLTADEEGLISKKFLYDESYVLYSKIRPYLRKCALAKGPGLCSADMYPIKVKDGLATREFVWMLLLSDYFTSYTETLPDRASIPKLNRNELSKFEFSLPDFVLQEKYSLIVKQTELLINKYEIGGMGVQQLFGSLSQKAFAGEL